MSNSDPQGQSPAAETSVESAFTNHLSEIQTQVDQFSRQFYADYESELALANTDEEFDLALARAQQKASDHLADLQSSIISSGHQLSSQIENASLAQDQAVLDKLEEQIEGL